MQMLRKICRNAGANEHYASQTHIDIKMGINFT